MAKFTVRGEVLLMLSAVVLQAKGFQVISPEIRRAAADALLPLPCRSTAGLHVALRARRAAVAPGLWLPGPRCAGRRSGVLGSLSMAASASDGILIVGGGPSGLGAALELDSIFNKELKDKWGGGAKITVIEKANAISSYDPNKGFMYLISELGLKFTDRHGLSETVAQEGVDGGTLNGNRIAIDGKRSKFKFSFGKVRTPYWLPRDGFVSILEQAVRKRTAVEVKEGWEVTALRRVPDGEHMAIEATLKDADGQEHTMRPFFVVGADGLRSVVRASLSQWAGEDGGNDQARFDMEEKPSPSGGLRYKVLKLKPTFSLPPNPDSSGATVDVIESEQSYTFLSRYLGSIKDKNKETRLGLLPLKAKYAYRTANIITWPDHSIWTNATLGTLAGMKDFLHDSYPQVPWDQAVTEEELERFARSPGGRFPQPQTTKGGAAWVSGSKEVGAVLLGDALHAFPPDLGQGVNSALKDVATLGDSLRNVTHQTSSPASTAFSLEKQGGGGRKMMAAALDCYEAEAAGEARALVRMMQLGSPYQYSQPGLRAFVMARLMTANLLLRLILSKIPFLGNAMFFPQIGLLTQLGGNLSYREMLDRAHRTSFGIAAICIAAGLALAKVVLGGVEKTVGWWVVFCMYVCLFKAFGA